MPGAAEYEKLVYEFLISEKDEGNINILSNAEILPGKATSRMSAQSLAHLIMVLFIILGNLSYYFQNLDQYQYLQFSFFYHYKSNFNHSPTLELHPKSIFQRIFL